MNDVSEFQQLFQGMVDLLQKRIELKAVILFGSRARGTAGSYSDYDLVIIAEFKESFLDRGSWVLELTPPVPLDLFCYTPLEFEQKFLTFNLTAMDAIGEGVVLYGAEFINPYRLRYEELVRQGMKKVKCALLPPEVARIYDSVTAAKITNSG